MAVRHEPFPAWDDAFRAACWPLWRAFGPTLEAIHPLGGGEALLVAGDLAAAKARMADPTGREACAALRPTFLGHGDRKAIRRRLAVRNFLDFHPGHEESKLGAHEALAWERALAEGATLEAAVPPPEETEALLALWERSVCATHGFLAEADVVAYRSLGRQAFASPDNRCVAVRGGGRPLGFMLLCGGHIDALFLEPSFTGLGLGARLLTHALSCGAMSIDVNEGNPRARRLYEAFGFRVVSRSPRDPMGKPYPILRLRRGG